MSKITWHYLVPNLPQFEELGLETPTPTPNPTVKNTRYHILNFQQCLKTAVSEFASTSIVYRQINHLAAGIVQGNTRI